MNVRTHVWNWDWLGGRGLAQILNQVLDKHGAGGDLAINGDVDAVAGGECDRVGSHCGSGMTDDVIVEDSKACAVCSVDSGVARALRQCVRCKNGCCCGRSCVWVYVRKKWWL